MGKATSATLVMSANYRRELQDSPKNLYTYSKIRYDALRYTDMFSLPCYVGPQLKPPTLTFTTPMISLMPELMCIERSLPGLRYLTL